MLKKDYVQFDIRLQAERRMEMISYSGARFAVVGEGGHFFGGILLRHMPAQKDEYNISIKPILDEAWDGGYFLVHEFDEVVPIVVKLRKEDGTYEERVIGEETVKCWYVSEYDDALETCEERYTKEAAKEFRLAIIRKLQEDRDGFVFAKEVPSGIVYKCGCKGCRELRVCMRSKAVGAALAFLAKKEG